MNGRIKKLLCFLLTATMSVTLAASGFGAEAGGARLKEMRASFEDVTGKVDVSALSRANFNSSVMKVNAASSETKTIIVSLDGATLLGGLSAADDAIEYLASSEGTATARAAQNAQNTFLKRLTARGVDYKVVGRLDAIANAVVLETPASSIATIKSIKGVDRAVVSETYSVPETFASGLSTALEATTDGNDETRVGVSNNANVYPTGIYDSSYIKETYGYSGAGVTVAIVDTGLDYTHRAFSETPKTPSMSKDDIRTAMNEGALASVAKSAARGQSIDYNDVYVSAKVPYAYDYADDDADVYPSYSNHGTHVAGIVAGHDATGWDDKDGVHHDEDFWGVAPDAQLVICKVFTDNLDSTDLGGAVSEDILYALEDCVKLGVDVINMSLGTTGGFSDTNDADDEGQWLEEVYESIRDAGISLVTAASNDYSAGYGGTFGTNLSTNPDSGTVGSPSTYTSALSVASISGQEAKYMVANEGTDDAAAIFFEESSDQYSEPYDFLEQMLGEEESAEYEYVVVPGVGLSVDFATVRRYFDEKPGERIAVVRRGDTTFQEKVSLAKFYGAKAVIVYNNVTGMIRMSLGDLEDPLPAVSVNLVAGNKLVAGAVNNIGKIKLDKSLTAGPFMSEFSSWGPTPDLRIKPEITAHGGEITSAVPGGYDEQSGTSMASPNMAGFVALVRGYIQDPANSAKFGADVSKQKVNELVNQLVMSTATLVKDSDDLPYSPRKQGAGLANMKNAIESSVLAKNASTEYSKTLDINDATKPKLEFGDDPNKNGVYEGTFEVENFGAAPVTFDLTALVFTESRTEDNKGLGLGVAEKAHMLGDVAPEFTVDEAPATSVTINPHETKKISVRIIISEAEKEYINENFANGMFVEGFVRLIAPAAEGNDKAQCDISLPFLAFFSDWSYAPMLDYNVFEISAFEQDPSYTEEERPQASIWATQAYNYYYNNTYVLPMGSYLYTLPDGADPMYTREEYSSLSRFNDYDATAENGYMTATSIYGLYTGLLRNARKVSYTFTDEYTGETIDARDIYRIGKAYAGGGSARPAFVKLEMDPVTNGLVNNGKYNMSFDFDLDWGDGSTRSTVDPETKKRLEDDNTFEFSFYVDYDAPVLQDLRVRYYNYKDSYNRDRQRIYLDFDIFDNHYAQSLLLCYVDDESGGNDAVLTMATDYVTPVRNPNFNGTTTVSLEVTDIWDRLVKESSTLGNHGIYVQLEDYALNHSVYYLSLEAANEALQTEEFGIVDDRIEINVNEARKLNFIAGEGADASNYEWRSGNPTIVKVKNGEVFGVKPGQVNVTVTGKGLKHDTIQVVVKGDNPARLATPSISFGVIRDDNDAFVKASGGVSVNAGLECQLEVIPDPWYYPVENLSLVWSSSDPKIATVDDNGNIVTRRKGSTVITAQIEGTAYSATVVMNVVEEFNVSNFTLRRYHGIGTTEEFDKFDADGKTPLPFEPDDEGTVIIPSDMNIMYIGEDAFRYNDNIRKIIIPKTVMEIQQYAFADMSALEEVYFMDDEPLEIADSSLSVIHYRAFYNCPNLKKVDFSNVKVITLGRQVFENCGSLKEIVKWEAIGTANTQAFLYCTSLLYADLTNLHSSGDYVFENCKSLCVIDTGRYTAIGNYMFRNCTSLGNPLPNDDDEPSDGKTEEIHTEITLKTPSIGAYAFAGIPIETVKFEEPEGAEDDVNFAVSIGSYAFARCSKLATVDFGTCRVRAIGTGAFSGTNINEISLPNGLETIGEGVFESTLAGPMKVTLNDNYDISTLYSAASPFAGVTVSEFALPESGSTRYSVENGVVYSKDFSRLLLVPNGKAEGFEINANTTEIGDNAFYGNNNLKSIDGGTLNFVSGAVTSTSIANVTVIGDNAFARSSLESVTLGAVSEIGEGAFRNCTKLESFDFGGATVTSIAPYALAYTRITSINVPGSVTSIGSYAFSNTSIETFAGFANGSEMGDGVFANCNNLVSIVLPDGIKTMGDSTFSGCSALREVTMPSVESLGSYTFSGSGVTTVTFGANAKTAGSRNLLTRSGYMETVPSLTSVTLGDQTTELEDYAFAGARLESIDLKNVSIIGNYAFAADRTLANVTGLENVTEIGEGAFMGTAIANADLQNATVIGNFAFSSQGAGYDAAPALATLDIPAAVTIGEGAFVGSLLESVEIPASVESIGEGAFNDSLSLTAINVDEGNERYFDDNGVLYAKKDEEYTLLNYPAAKADEQYRILDGTVYIAARAAYQSVTSTDGALKEIIFPYSVRAIGHLAFYGCSALTYTFETINAPALLSDADVGFMINGNYYAVEDLYPYWNNGHTVTTFVGFFYGNFRDMFYNYHGFRTADSSQVIQQQSPLTLRYPVNGVGYDNYIYTRYFATRETTEILMNDYTRETKKIIEGLADADEVEKWLERDNTPETIAEITEFAEKVKDARVRLGNITDANQLAFLNEEENNSEKLAALEVVLREVKAHFGIPVNIVRLQYGGNFRSDYKAGETFDMTGLVITAVYDDFSEEEIDPSEVTLITTEQLTRYHTTVKVRAAGTEIEIPVTVTDEGGTSSSGSSSGEQPKDGPNVGLIVGLTVGGVAIVAIAAAAAIFILKKKNVSKKENSDKAQENNSDETDEDNSER